MFSCVASQPIFNAKMEIFGYELLYRSNADSACYDGIDSDVATEKVLVTAFGDIGVEEITGGKRAFVNFTADLLFEEIPQMLSNNILVVELLESVVPTEEVIKACRKLKNKGYLLALDDFVYREDYEPLLDIADIVKIDFLQCDEAEIRSAVEKIRKKSQAVLLAEKIETDSVLELAKSMGFALFQGYFFCKPSISTAKSISAETANELYLFKLISEPDISFSRLAEVIKRDVVLSYRLLKIVNSAYYGLNYTVNSILHAITILGLVEIRKWIMLLLLNRANAGKSNELIRMALIRGIFMEKLSVYLQHRREMDEYFLVGLFSLADTIMGAPMENILEEAHLNAEISEPLITGRGERAQLLDIIRHIENAEWCDVIEASEKCRIDINQVGNAYMKAVKEANKLLE